MFLDLKVAVPGQRFHPNDNLFSWLGAGAANSMNLQLIYYMLGGEMTTCNIYMVGNSKATTHLDQLYVLHISKFDQRRPSPPQLWFSPQLPVELMTPGPAGL